MQRATKRQYRDRHAGVPIIGGSRRARGASAVRLLCPASTLGAAARAGDVTHSASRDQRLRKRSDFAIRADPNLVRLGATLPSPELFPIKELNRTMAAVSRRAPIAAHSYEVP